MITRDLIQKEAVKFYSEHQFIALEWCTGLGKSKAAMDIITHVRNKLTKIDKKAHILLVIAELAHEMNWKEDFKKWGVSTEYITITTYASLKKHTRSTYDILILDEAHHIGSDLRIDILTDLKFKSLVCLSATLPIETKEVINSIVKGQFKSFTITLQEAIDAEILPEPKIHILPLELNDTIKNQPWIKERGTKSKRITVHCSYDKRWLYLKDKINYPHLTLKSMCTEKEFYFDLSYELDFYKKLYFRTRNEGIKNKWMLIGSTRKRYLGSLKDKKALEIMHLLKGRRYICFCSSVAQAELLGKDNSIHSKKKGAIDTIESFNNKEIDTLFAIGMIQEGTNLTDIEAAIIVQLDGKERAFVQKSGRAMRAEAPEIYIIYYKDTRDEEYLTNALEGLSKEYIIII